MRLASRMKVKRRKACAVGKMAGSVEAQNSLVTACVVAT